MKTSNHRPTKAVVDLAAISFNIKQLLPTFQTMWKSGLW